MFNWIVMDVITMLDKVCLIANPMLPESSLPEVAFLPLLP
jgi:hypothetical protein